MQNIISTCQDVFIKLRMDSKYTIKAAVADLTAAGLNDSLWDTKTRISFIDSISAHIEQLSESVLVNELDSLKAEITAVIETAGNSHFELGGLLLKARDACDSQAEFLEWVNTNFGIKKTWAFSLMKVAQVFEGEPWNRVPVKVLYVLQAQATDEQLAEAKKFAEAGKLDTAAVKALLQPPVAAVKPTVSTAEPEALRAAESVAAALISDSVAPAEPVEPEAEPEIKAPEQLTAATESPEVQQYQIRITELLDTVQQLSAQVAELTKPRLRTGADLPMLPQFSSECMYARLGLSQQDAASKEKVLDAFKALCKAGYGRQHKEAFALLDEARHELCHATEAQEVAA